MTNKELMQCTKDELKQLPKEMVKKFIRLKLGSDSGEPSKTPHETNHKRFDMSGEGRKYEDTTLETLDILNIFSYLGIYKYTKFLLLEFYKGVGTLHFRYWQETFDRSVDFGGLGTIDIIYEIFKLTIFTDKLSKSR